MDETAAAVIEESWITTYSPTKNIAYQAYRRSGAQSLQGRNLNTSQRLELILHSLNWPDIQADIIAACNAIAETPQ